MWIGRLSNPTYYFNLWAPVRKSCNPFDSFVSESGTVLPWLLLQLGGWQDGMYGSSLHGVKWTTEIITRLAELGEKGIHSHDLFLLEGPNLLSLFYIGTFPKFRLKRRKRRWFNASSTGRKGKDFEDSVLHKLPTKYQVGFSPSSAPGKLSYPFPPHTHVETVVTDALLKVPRPHVLNLRQTEKLQFHITKVIPSSYFIGSLSTSRGIVGVCPSTLRGQIRGLHF